MPVRAMFESPIAIKDTGHVDLEYEVLHADNPMRGVISSFAHMRGVLARMVSSGHG